jgi:hypothetical protein
MGFSMVMLVSGEADPFHLSAVSPSTGQPAYFEEALMRRQRTLRCAKSLDETAPFELID